MEWRASMRIDFATLATIAGLSLLANFPAAAQQGVALKSGESTEVSDVYFVLNCKSALKSPAEVAILDGPPGVTATIKPAMVVPRTQRCAAPIAGGKLILTAGTIEDESTTIMTVRVRYNTVSGVRDISTRYSISLFP